MQANKKQKKTEKDRFVFICCLRENKDATQLHMICNRMKIKIQQKILNKK